CLPAKSIGVVVLVQDECRSILLGHRRTLRPVNPSRSLDLSATRTRSRQDLYRAAGAHSRGKFDRGDLSAYPNTRTTLAVLVENNKASGDFLFITSDYDSVEQTIPAHRIISVANDKDEAAKAGCRARFCFTHFSRE